MIMGGDKLALVVSLTLLFSAASSAFFFKEDDNDSDKEETTTPKNVSEGAESGDFLGVDDEDRLLNASVTSDLVPFDSAVATITQTNSLHRGRHSASSTMSDLQHASVSHPDLQKLDRYIQSCPRCMVRWNSVSLCPLDNIALQLTTWLQELRELLSMGCKMSYVQRQCTERGRCCVGDDPIVLDFLQDLNLRIRDAYRVLQTSCDRCPEDCVWGEWGEWSECSVVCGTGNIHRTRTPQPSAKNGGKECEGPGRQQKSCVQKCCVDGGWGSWGSWSTCPVTCGVHLRERRRACDSPPPNDCGKPCPGFYIDTENGRCGPDPVHGDWAPWNAWSDCVTTCGIGTRDRSRTCSSPSPNPCGCKCTGQDREVVTCSGPRGGEGGWGQWGPWSPCDVTCGTGTLQRRRLCNNPPPDPTCGGACPGPDTETSQRQCGPTPVDGNWGGWETWNPCPLTCECVQQERRRRCDNPPANLCGQPCPGHYLDTRVCKPNNVDGNWGLWGPWGACSQTCGEAQQVRTRSCNNPPPRCEGRICPGSATDFKKCLERPCQPPPPPPCEHPSWGQWEEWSRCPVTCGRGMVRRTRSCLMPASRPDCPPTTCLGNREETTYIECGPPPADGNWGSWGPWGACSVTCNGGQRVRTRGCNSPHPQCGGRMCPGRELQSEACGLSPCPPVCEWTPWEDWSGCSITCDRGTRRRFRTCRPVHSNDYRLCIDRCPGPPVQDGSCEMPPCSTTAWGHWGEWCPCDCRKGERSRKRTCMVLHATGEREVDASQCQRGVPTDQSREVEYCDVRDEKTCPKCITSCDKQEDGLYSSCSGCSQYVNCKRNAGYEESCGDVGEEWDQYNRTCKNLHSPSCSIVPCLTSCADRRRGLHHSCSGCQYYLDCQSSVQKQCSGGEFNMHSMQCEPKPSPTCPRPFGSTIDVFYPGMLRDSPYSKPDHLPQTDQFDDSSVKYELVQNDGAMMRSKQDTTHSSKVTEKDTSRADNLFVSMLSKTDTRPENGTFVGKDKEGKSDNGMSDERSIAEVTHTDGSLKEDKGSNIEENTQKQTGQKKSEKEEKNEVTIDATRTRGRKTKTVLTNERKNKRRHSHTSKHQGRHKHGKKTSPCQSECSGLEAGDYPSCRGCEYYIVCTKHGLKVERRCEGNTKWDDVKKRCVTRSATCGHDNELPEGAESVGSNSVMPPAITSLNVNRP